MDHLSLQEELQSVIMQSITLAPQTTRNNLNIYKKHFGADNFYTQASLAFSQQSPLVSSFVLTALTAISMNSFPDSYMQIWK